jgi:hypothetical protein
MFSYRKKNRMTLLYLIRQTQNDENRRNAEQKEEEEEGFE